MVLIKNDLNQAISYWAKKANVFNVTLPSPSPVDFENFAHAAFFCCIKFKLLLKIRIMNVNWFQINTSNSEKCR